MTQDLLLGVDLGTTNTKVMAIATDGAVAALVAEPTPIVRVIEDDGQPVDMYDAEALWQTVAGLIRRLSDQLPDNRAIHGIAVASMAESGVLLDRSGQPLAPVISWYDNRTLPSVARCRERISDSRLFQLTGQAARHIYSAHKLIWTRDHRPELFARAETWLCLGDWINFRLCGARRMSYSLASRTMLFDLRERRWSDELLGVTELPSSLLPELAPSGCCIGRVSDEAARVTGLPSGLPVVTGGHDHSCAALAAGVINPGPCLDSSGTAEAFVVALREPALSPEVEATGFACGCHTAKDRYYLLGGIMGGGIVNWVSRMLAGADDPDTVSRLMELAAASPPGANGVWFEPYLDGSGPPKRDPEAWGAWLGLRLKHTRGDLVRAAMEGLTYGIRLSLEGIQRAAGAPAEIVRVVGGGSRNKFWMGLRADVTALPFETLPVSDLAAQGAAMLAGIGAGVYANDEAAAAVASAVAAERERYVADPARHAFYAAAYRDSFLKLAPALKSLPLG